MTPEQFEMRARSCRNRQDLEELMRNALAKGRKDLAEIAKNLLDDLFPVRSRRTAGATPSSVTFLTNKQRFPSGKEGYVWLVDQFGAHKEHLFAEYEEFHRKRKSRGCRLARTPAGLFPVGSSRVQTDSNYSRVTGGWYVDANLNHAGKFALLLQLGYLAKLWYPVDWNFEIEGGTEELEQRQKAIVSAEKILQELLAFGA